MTVCPHCGAQVEPAWKFCVSCTQPLGAPGDSALTAAPSSPAVAVSEMAHPTGGLHLQMKTSELRIGFSGILDFLVATLGSTAETATLTVLCSSLERGQVRSAPALLHPGVPASFSLSAVASVAGEAIATVVVELGPPGSARSVWVGTTRLWIFGDAAVHVGTTINLAEGARGFGIDASITMKGGLGEQLDEARGAPAWYLRGRVFPITLHPAPPDFEIPRPTALLDEAPDDEEVPVDLSDRNDAAYREFVDAWGQDAARLDDLVWELGDPARGMAAWAAEKWARMCEAAGSTMAPPPNVDAMACAEGPAAVAELFGWEMTAVFVHMELATHLHQEPALDALQEGDADRAITLLERHPSASRCWLRVALAYARFFYKGDSDAALIALNAVPEPPDTVLLFKAFVFAMRSEPEESMAALSAISGPQLETLVALLRARQIALLSRHSEAAELWAELARRSKRVAIRLHSEPGIERSLLRAVSAEVMRPLREDYQARLGRFSSRLAQRREAVGSPWPAKLAAAWVSLINAQMADCRQASAIAPDHDEATLMQLIDALPALGQRFLHRQQELVSRADAELVAAVEAIVIPAASEAPAGGLRGLFGRKERVAAELERDLALHQRRQAEAALAAFRESLRAISPAQL